MKPDGALRPNRAELLAEHRTALVDLLRDTAGRADADLAGYVATVVEPSGYMLAIGLQKHCGKPDPDPIIRRALAEGLVTQPVIVGVMSRCTLSDLLDLLAPRLAELGSELRSMTTDPASPTSLPVLVTGSGGAEVLMARPPGRRLDPPGG